MGSSAIQVTAAGGAGGTTPVTATDGALVTVGTTTDAEAASGNGTLVALLKRIRTLLAGGLPAALAANGGLKIEGVASGVAVPVSGTFFQGTQPVSGTVTANIGTAGTLALDATLTGGTQKTKIVDTGGTNVATVSAAGAVKVDGSAVTQPVSGTFFQATQPVSGTVTANQGTAAAASGAWPAKITDGTNVVAVKAASTLAAATDPAIAVQQSPMRADASTLAVTATGAAAAAVTLTLPAPAAGLFHYITSIEVTRFASALLVAGATPVLVTTTNLPGSPVYSIPADAAAAGTVHRYQVTPTTPLKSSVAATATTIVCPLTVTTIWRVNVTYYTAP